MSTSDSCDDFTETVVSTFQQFVLDLDRQGPNEGQDLILLNANTRVLNDEIVRFQRNRLEFILKSPLSAIARIEFQTRFIPDELKAEYRKQLFPNLESLADYVLKKSELRRLFQTRSDVINRVGSIQPQLYPTFENQYPALASRLREGPISTAEVASISQQYGLNQNQLAERIRANVSGFLGLLQRLLSGLGLGLGLMGSFCSLIDNIYGTSNGVRNTLGNNAAFAPNLSTVLSSIEPRIPEILQTVGSVRSFIEDIKSDSSNMETSMKNAFELIGNAMNIATTFFDRISGNSGKVSIDWDFEKIKDAIDDAIGNVEPEKALFITNQAVPGRPLADFNNDSIVDQDDLDLLQEYIDEELEDLDVIGYIENIMKPYMTNEIRDYTEYTEYSSTSSNPNGADISGVIETLTNVVGFFGSTSSPNSGDFGISKLNQMIGSISNIQSNIQGLVSSIQQGLPINIDSIINQIKSIRDLASQVSENIFGDMKETLDRFKSTVEEALGVAESVSVSDPTRTREIQGNRQISVEENLTRVLNLSARTTSNIVPVLGQQLTALERQLRNAAATGILNTVEERLVSVVEQSANQLRSIVSNFTATSLDNGFNYNMTNSFARFTGLKVRALSLTSDESVEHMQNVVRGTLANSTRGYRDLNRENVEFIALRSCNLAGEIERIYNSFTEPLEQMIRRFQSANGDLQAFSNSVTESAVRAGATRLPSSARPQLAESAATTPATVTSPYATSTGNISTTPEPGTLLRNDPRPPLPREYDDLPYYDDLKSGIVWNGLFKMSSWQIKAGPLWWNPILEEFKHNGIEMLRRFIRLCAEWNEKYPSLGPVVIISAFRPRAVTPSGNTSNHAVAKALDCKIVNESSHRFTLPQKIDFCNVAYNNNMKGLIIYQSFIHISTSPTEGPGGIIGEFKGTFGEANYYTGLNRQGRTVLEGPLGNRRVIGLR
jgi:hypothetical protein